MLTIFSIPKKFSGEFATIQRNAIQSWMQLRPACEVFLMGDDPGTREAAAEFGAQHIPDIAKNEFGTPLLDDIFHKAEKRASFRNLCYINADIILLNDITSAVQDVSRRFERFLMIGHRWDLDVREPLAFENGWEESIRSRVRRDGVLHSHSSSDYFIFPRGMWKQIPPFAIGRTVHDQWLVYSTRAQSTAVIDATKRVTAVHQNHSYAHHPGGLSGTSNGVEARRNMQLAGGLRKCYTLRDASHRLTDSGVDSRPLPYDLWRALVVPVITHSSVRPLVCLAKSAVQTICAPSKRMFQARITPK